MRTRRSCSRNVPQPNAILANLRRQVNKSLAVQQVQRVIEIEGQDLRIASKYEGYSRVSGVTFMEFSVGVAP